MKRQWVGRFAGSIVRHDIVKDMRTSLTGKKQVTVPAEIASELQLTPGTRFEWSVGDAPNTILIHIQPSRKAMLARLRQIGIEARTNEPDSVSHLIADRMADVADDHEI